MTNQSPITNPSDDNARRIIRTKSPVSDALKKDDPHDLNLYIQDAVYEARSIVAIIDQVSDLNSREQLNGLQVITSNLQDRLDDILAAQVHLHSIIDNSAANRAGASK